MTTSELEPHGGSRNENIPASKLYESAAIWNVFRDLVTTRLENLDLRIG